ncbi:MAG: DegT/DnrJ/EryC1/StrS family aminotransferase, partial [Candidatus Colwellbacteria bacterium]|nr:DegT/DnrJ/EryC1/StrS family aminotransferase [Candidatus Colwellbacteria bacterium]
GPGDEVITVDHTFLASIAAIALAGAKPVLIDVGDDFNMDVGLLEAAITPKTKAVMPVHLNGHMCDMDALMQIAKSKGLIVIEDAAQSLGAKMQMANGPASTRPATQGEAGEWRMAGSIGITGCFSHYPFKMLGAFGEAGTLTTNDSEIDEKVLLLRYHGVMRDPARTQRMFGYNAVLDNIQATILNVKLKHYDEWINRRREIAEKYREGLSKIEDLKLPHFNDNRYFDVYQNYVIRSSKRDALKQHLESQGVETQIKWPVPNYSYDWYPYEAEPLPKTEQICREILSLPMYPELTDDEVDFVIQTVKNFYT